MIKKFMDVIFKILASLILLPLLAIAQVRAAEPQSHYVLVQTALEKHVLPAFEVLNKNASRLPEKVALVCSIGTDGSREELTSAFRDTVLDWAAVEFFRFGPMTEGGRRERMSFWPDPRGIMNRQLRQLLVSKDFKAIEDGAIVKQSAALQGLPALEVLMTDKDSPLGIGENSEFRCKYAAALATNIANMAQELNDGWTKSGGWRDKMLRPGSDNDTYKEPQEAASELVKALLVGFQLVGDGEVKPRLDPATTFTGPYAKANLSKDYFEAGIASLAQLYESMNLESYLPDDKDWVKNWAGGAWRTVKASDGAGGRGFGVAKGDAPPLRKVFDMISGLRKLVIGEISVAAGLTVGFNELDGD